MGNGVVPKFDIFFECLRRREKDWLDNNNGGHRFTSSRRVNYTSSMILRLWRYCAFLSAQKSFIARKTISMIKCISRVFAKVTLTRIFTCSWSDKSLFLLSVKMQFFISSQTRISKPQKLSGYTRE